MRGKIYKLHRTLSLIIAVPVLLWAASGFMHPLMTNIRPSVASQSLLPAVVDTHHVRMPLREALLNNAIENFTQCRLIHIDTNWFYQVQQAPASVPVYVSTLNGHVLSSGDWLYAQYLARQFLEGQQFNEHKNAAQQSTIIPVTFPSTADCCGEATTCVLKSKGSSITNAHRLTSFDNEYKSINRLLPVYKVSFNRPHGIRVYVETTQDRFAFAMDNKRAVFDEVFRLFHTWGWLEFAGRGKYLVEGGVALTAFLTALLGIYLFFTTTAKKANGNKLVKGRRYHRYTAITAVLFTLLWSGSGAYHALSKLKERQHVDGRVANNIRSTDIYGDLHQLQARVPKPITNFGLARINDSVYWRISTQLTDAKKGRDLMKDQAADLQPVVYVNAISGSILAHGEQQYAQWLASQLSGHAPEDIRDMRPVTQFTDEYNFTSKRLPVWKLSYASNHHERYYVETCSGELAAYINDQDIPEGYSFSVFHKHHFMDWGGKSIRDLSTMIWALAQVLMVTMGLILYFRWRTKRSHPMGKRV